MKNTYMLHVPLGLIAKGYQKCQATKRIGKKRPQATLVHRMYSSQTNDVCSVVWARRRCCCCPHMLVWSHDMGPLV
jgi:hypothetical protein